MLHGLLCEGHGCSIDGEVRVDPKVIASASWEHTCAKHYPIQFLHNFVKWQLLFYLFHIRGSCGAQRWSTSTTTGRGRPRRCAQAGFEEPMLSVLRLQRGWLAKAAPPGPTSRGPRQPCASTLSPTGLVLFHIQLLPAFGLLSLLQALLSYLHSFLFLVIGVSD